MLTEKEATKISKFLSLVLRHQPETINIELDKNGWVAVDELIHKSNKKGVVFDRELLFFLVETNAKKRFALNESKDKIRASQGHSIAIELGYENQEPPEILFHGTGQQSVESILKTGLEKRARQHVHLSKDVETAIKVGQRHGKPVVLKVLAAQMFQANYSFYLAENGVWLTDFVPANYLEL